MKNYTHVSVLLDASSSMYSIKDDIIGGFNNLLNDQKKETGKLSISVAQFSSEGSYKTINQMAELNSVKELTTDSYITSGMTALLDGIEIIIKDTGEALKALSENERPEKVLITIITDGGENNSIKATNKSIADIIKHQEEKYNWQFAYIGANQDSFATSSSFGLHTNTVNYSADKLGTQSMFAGMSNSIKTFRSSSANTSYTLTQEDIDKAKVVQK